MVLACNNEHYLLDGLSDGFEDGFIVMMVLFFTVVPVLIGIICVLRCRRRGYGMLLGRQGNDQPQPHGGPSHSGSQT